MQHATPSAENLLLGAGMLWFDRKLNGASTGERHLGHCSKVTLATTAEKIEKYNNMVASRRLYKSVIRQLSATIKITMDELDGHNLALALNGDTADVTQTEGLAAAQEFTAKKGRYVQLGKRNAAITEVAPHDAIIADIGDATALGTITTTGDVTSGGLYDGTEPETIYIVVSTKETAPGSIAGGKFQWKAGKYGAWSAEVAMGVAVALEHGVTVTFAAIAAETFVVGDQWTIVALAAKIAYALTTDYVLDAESGRFMATEDGAIQDDEILKITWSWGAETVPSVRAATVGNIEGFLRFKGDPGSGPKYEMEAWNVAITPDGDIGLIGEEFASFGLTAACQDDTVNHPLEPYMRLLGPL